MTVHGRGRVVAALIVTAQDTRCGIARKRNKKQTYSNEGAFFHDRLLNTAERHGHRLDEQSRPREREGDGGRGGGQQIESPPVGRPLVFWWWKSCTALEHQSHASRNNVTARRQRHGSSPGEKPSAEVDNTPANTHRWG